MLSYRHAFHAGNFADVLKHIVLVEILAYLGRKDKPFDFIDTHAGAGLYNLRSPQAEKTGEYRDGAGRLQAADWPELARWFDVLAHYNPGAGERYYPGSPGFALQLLRPGDRAWLFELHGSDYPLLANFVGDDKRVRLRREDGLAGMLALLPPASRRGLVLVDPSYEVKTEYRQVLDAVQRAYRKFPTGIYAIWYPVVSRAQADWFERQWRASGIADIQVYELAQRKDADGGGMTSSCVLVINPPWTLRDTMTALLPRLVAVLGYAGSGFSRVAVLSSE